MVVARVLAVKIAIMKSGGTVDLGQPGNGSRSGSVSCVVRLHGLRDQGDDKNNHDPRIIYATNRFQALRKAEGPVTELRGDT